MAESPQPPTAPIDPDIQKVLNKAHYHKFVLPGGCETDGVDWSATANLIFAGGLAGKSVLDVGCYHGYYLIEAKKRGAACVVGVEGRDNRIKIARLIQKILGVQGIEIVRGMFPKVRLNPPEFDVVLLMNVVHHAGSVAKARAMILAAAKAARERLVLSIRPPASEPGIDAEDVKHIETMVTVETRIDPETGKRVEARRALLSRRFICDLLTPIMRSMEIHDAPDYPGRFIAIGKK
ncbi:MAG: class I SAM-dependent methyltransferase [Candidatus Sumerlaeota bacterium]|nr:class I SAM-dependent methyltransferase [Candidatus Sumerlaeota bacterium]